MSANPPPTATAPESATTALYRAALGPVNTAHYLAVFERFDDAGRAGPVWNPAAGLLTLNWMVFRRLWGSALVYLACAQGLALLVLVAARRFLQWPPSVQWGVLLALLLLSIAIPGAYGNALLHADTRRRMTRAVREARTVREACAALEKQAGSRRRLGVLVVVNLLLVGAFGAAWLGGGLQSGLPGAAVQAIHPPVLAVPAAPATEPEPVAQAVAALPPTPESAPEPAAPAPEPVPVTVTPPVLPAPPPPVAVTDPPAEPTVVAAPPAAPRARSKADASMAPAAAPLPQAHGINVGLFADPANAAKAHARLVEAGFPAILQKVESPKGELTRVRVGPFASRALADEAAARIRAMGLDAVVFAP